MAKYLFFIAFIFVSAVGFSEGNQPAINVDSKVCLECHGKQFYSIHDSVSGANLKRPMNQSNFIDTLSLLASNHKTLSCKDCHIAEGFDKFPHPVEARFEFMYTCIDCHSNDPKYSKYNFEEIDLQYQESVHAKVSGETFSCWKCHNPHSYKANVRSNVNIRDAIAYDNAICLNCHSNFDRYSLLTEHKEINLIEKHEWLPNQGLHFSQVRCIECHAQVHDSILVSHMVLPKAKAVKKCVECHSENSILMASLYRYKSRENRSKVGFLNAIMLNDSYVIGANRNVYLNILSIIIFGLVFLFVSVHFTRRIIIRRKKNTSI